MEAVKHLFLAGRANMSVREIAQKAGVSKALIFHFFGTKEVLLHEVSKQMSDYFINSLSKVVNMDLSAEKKLQYFFNTLALVSDQGRFFMNFFFHKTIMQDQDYLVIEQSSKEKFVKVLQLTIDQGVREGLFSEKDSQLIFMIFMRFLHSMMMQKVFKDQCDEMKVSNKSFDYLISLFKNAKS